MDLEKVREYCLSKKAANESMPFDEDSLVIKVHNKIFCILNMKFPYSINLKCEPELALELRNDYEGVSPGYHMNKKHWNTILLDSDIPEKLIKVWIDNSYNLVVKKLPKHLRENLI